MLGIPIAVKDDVDVAGFPTSFGAAGSIRPATELWRYAAVAVYSFHIRACHEQSSAMLGAVTCLTTCRDFSPLHPRVMYGGG